MTEAEAIEVVFERWAAVWPGLHPTIPYAFEAEAFTGVDTYAIVTVQHTVAQQRSQGAIGSRRWSYSGNIWVQLFGAVDKGRRPLSLLVADVRTIFQGLSLPGPSGGEPMTTYATATREGTTDDRWMMQIAITPFDYWALA